MSKPRIVVDRIEGSVAVLEVAGQIFEVPVQLLPPGVAEGAVLGLHIESSARSTVSADRLARLQAESAIGDDFSF